MKKLQSDFTTKEQSLRLLELGVPAWTANYYFDSWEQIRCRILGDLDEDFFEKYSQYIPSWSAGRLIELYMKARGLDFMYFRIMSDANMIDSIFRMFVENKFDFSKLEE